MPIQKTDRPNLHLTCLGQIFSIISVVLVSFSIGVVIYQNTQSLTLFGYVVIAGYLPELLIAPIAGILTDRFPRKIILLFCCAFQALITCLLYSLVSDGHFSIPILLIAVVVSSLLGGFHRNAYNASITLFSKNPKLYAKHNGFVQAGIACAQCFAPILAGEIFESGNLKYIFMLGFCLYSTSFISLVLVTFPELQDRPKAGHKFTFFSDFKFGIQQLRGNKALVSFLSLHIFSNFARGSVVVLFTPLILSYSTADHLGILRSMAGFGMVVGAALITLWGGPQRHFQGVVYSLFGCGLFMALIGTTANLYLIGISVFCLFVITPILVALSHSIWQQEIEEHIQGRVFGFRDALAGSAMALAFYLVPLFTEKVVTINYDFSATASNTISPIGLIYVGMGLFTILLSWYSTKSKSLSSLSY